MALSSDETAEDALADACRRVRGAWALIVLTRGRVLACAMRRLAPLCLGRLGDGYVLASGRARSIWSAPITSATSSPARW
jgi:glutamine phosphoribosylpyrophosphate amidotransferase